MLIKDKLLVRYLMEVSLVNGQILEKIDLTEYRYVLVTLHSFNAYTN